MARGPRRRGDWGAAEVSPSGLIRGVSLAKEIPGRAGDDGCSTSPGTASVVRKKESPSDLIRGSPRSGRSRGGAGMTVELLPKARNQGRASDRRASAGPAPWAGALAVGSSERRARMYVAAIKYGSGEGSGAAPRSGAGTASVVRAKGSPSDLIRGSHRSGRSRVKPGMTWRSGRSRVKPGMTGRFGEIPGQARDDVALRADPQPQYNVSRYRRSA
jgi:hypothetical protein